MRRLLCFLFVLSHAVPALGFSGFDDDCGCSGQSVVLNDETRDALEIWESQQVWDRPTLLASNVSAIIRSDFGDFTSQRVLFDPLREANAMRENLNLFEEIITHSISTASSDTLTIEERRRILEEKRIRMGIRHMADHDKKDTMCRQISHPDSIGGKRFIRTLRFKRISFEQIFRLLRCPIKSPNYNLCKRPDAEERDPSGIPYCGDIFLMAAINPATARTFVYIMDSFKELDREARFLPQVLQCKRKVKFYDKEKGTVKTRCLTFREFLKNREVFLIHRYPRDTEAQRAFHELYYAIYHRGSPFHLQPDESPPSRAFCEQYTTLSCQEDLPERNAW